MALMSTSVQLPRCADGPRPHAPHAMSRRGLPFVCVRCSLPRTSDASSLLRVLASRAPVTRCATSAGTWFSATVMTQFSGDCVGTLTVAIVLSANRFVINRDAALNQGPHADPKCACMYNATETSQNAFWRPTTRQLASSSPISICAGKDTRSWPFPGTCRENKVHLDVRPLSSSSATLCRKRKRGSWCKHTPEHDLTNEGRQHLLIAPHPNLQGSARHMIDPRRLGTA